MPELETCAYCKMPIYPEDNYLEAPLAVPEPGDEWKPQYTRHAHAKCYEQMAELAKEAAL
jgi:hypothetical protein